MYEAVPMDLAECRRQANGDAQQASQIERLPLVPLKNKIQRLTARVREYEDRPLVVTSKRQRLGCPRRIEVRCERALLLEPPDSLGGPLVCRPPDRPGRRRGTVLSGAAKP